MYAQQGPVVMAPMNGAVMMPSYTVETYCGPISWLIGIFLFPCICFCPIDERRIATPMMMGGMQPMMMGGVMQQPVMMGMQQPMMMGGGMAMQNMGGVNMQTDYSTGGMMPNPYAYGQQGVQTNLGGQVTQQQQQYAPQQQQQYAPQPQMGQEVPTYKASVQPVQQQY